MRLSSQLQQLLIALRRGGTLKVHRTMDGVKTYRLHPLNGAPAQEVPANVVDALQRMGLVNSNMKFPAATFLLTEKGAQRSTQLQHNDSPPPPWHDYQI